MDMQSKIQKRLDEHFSPEMLEIKNESAKHRGHAGHDGSDQSHFRVTMRCAELNGLARVEAQRKVNDVLKDLFDEGLHALSLRINQ